ncbi:MAG TPA: bifunctional molybdenum cofactor biosynthesis protein MoaC/MoaB [Bacteroidota bacterium]|nr:bifunctional molybdenum cofactor biosynthesis protein MoaC/MoaB [Bacteroidota bacterium]
MRDVSAKPNTLRSAVASCTLIAAPATIRAIRKGTVPKADPVGVAKIAGIQAAKQTALLIPYCHQVPVDFVRVDISLGAGSLEIRAEVKAVWKTGVEMEALVAVTAAALTLYDMLKIIDDGMEIRSARLIGKQGGVSSTTRSAAGLTAAVLVTSDSVSEKFTEDLSGKYLADQLGSLGFTVRHYAVVPDEQWEIERTLLSWCESPGLDLILTTGGTGVGPRDVTPDATSNVITRRLDGVEETFRAYGQNRIPTAMLSRGVAGVRGRTVIINLPGSIRGAEDAVRSLFPAVLHAFPMLRGEGHGGRKIRSRTRRRAGK